MEGSGRTRASCGAQNQELGLNIEETPSEVTKWRRGRTPQPSFLAGNSADNFVHPRRQRRRRRRRRRGYCEGAPICCIFQQARL